MQQPAAPSGEQDQCVFCKIVSGEIPSRKVYEDDLLLAILDIRPAAPGHLLILPKQHATVMPQLPKEIVARLAMTVKVLSKVLLKAFPCEGTTLFIANGSAAGQKSPHFMLHLIPRFKDDDLPLQPPGQEVGDEFLSKLKGKLVPQAPPEAHPQPTQSEEDGRKEDSDVDVDEIFDKEEGSEEETPIDEADDDTEEDDGEVDLDAIDSLFG